MCQSSHGQESLKTIKCMWSGCKGPPSHKRLLFGLGLSVFNFFSFASTYFAGVDLLSCYMYDVQGHQSENLKGQNLGKERGTYMK